MGGGRRQRGLNLQPLGDLFGNPLVTGVEPAIHQFQELETVPLVARACIRVRVRYTGEPAYLVIGCQVRSQGILLKFSFDLQKAAAENKNNYDISQWNYQWTSNYGSEQFSVKNPREEGVDVVEIAEAVLLEDGRSVLLKIPDIRPVDQMRIQLEVSARDNTVLQESIYLTINKVPNN